MNKIINGKKYDTKTAKKLADYENMYDCNNFEYYSERLYRTKSGNYFLYGEGGGNSRYGEWHGNSGGPGSRIMPLSEDDAREWVESHCDAEEYEEIFGRIDEGFVAFAMQVPPSVRDRFQALKAERGLTAAGLLDELLNRPEEGRCKNAPRNNPGA